MRAWLFRLELGFRADWGLDCAACIQREINRLGRMPRLPLGSYRIKRPLDFRDEWSKK